MNSFATAPRTSKRRPRRVERGPASTLLLLTLVLSMHATPVDSFSPHLPSTRSPRTSQTQQYLFGIGSLISSRRKQFDSDVSSSTLPTTTNGIASPEEEEEEEKETLAPAAAIAQLSDQSLYSMPPVPEGTVLTELEKEFRALLKDFTKYTERDIVSVRDPRLRALCEGVAASSGVPAVYRAFVVLFEDFFPIRVAGRIIHKRLSKAVEESIAERQEEVARVLEESNGLDPMSVEQARFVFISLAFDMNHDSYLTREQAADIGLLDGLVERLGLDSPEVILDYLCNDDNDDNDDENKEDRFTFVDAISGVQRCASEVCSIQDCNAAALVESAVADLRNRPLPQKAPLDPREVKHNERYTYMVESFKEWEDYIPVGDGRRLDIVRGCFVGARNEKVVEALRIVYTDYTALRVAGDLIFKIASSLIKGVQTRRARRG